MKITLLPEGRSYTMPGLQILKLNVFKLGFIMVSCIPGMFMHLNICKDIKRNQASESIVRSPCLNPNIIFLIQDQKETKGTAD